MAKSIKRQVPELYFAAVERGKDSDKRNIIVSSHRTESKTFKLVYSLDEGLRDLIKGYEVFAATNCQITTWLNPAIKGH